MICKFALVLLANNFTTEIIIYLGVLTGSPSGPLGPTSPLDPWGP